MEYIRDQEFVIFDVETTGLSPEDGDRVVEVAALRIKNLKPEESWVSFIDPCREISFGAFQVNGITPQMLKGAPPAEKVLPELLEFMKGAYCVGHNIKFDLRFLQNELLLINRPPDEEIAAIDTLRMARALLPGMGQYSLLAVAHYLDIDLVQEHRALADVRMTFEVFRKLLEIAERKDIDRIEHLLHLFGSHKGSDSQNSGKVELINEAIEAKRELNVLYFSLSSAATTLRRITPLKIRGRGRQMMVVGFCHLRKEERNFKLDRILHLEKL
ncbi:MAG: exonuclease domain-containing protein [Candidatus Omnitrophota bacterium]